MTSPNPEAVPDGVAALAASIDGLLGAVGRPALATSILQEASGPLVRLGFALEPAPTHRGWIGRERLDGLFLHRHWGVEAALSGCRIAMVASHEGFDRRFGFGDAPELRVALGLVLHAGLPDRDGYPLGSLADGEPITVAALRERLVAIFGGVDGEIAGRTARPIRRVAIARAMTADLVRAAAAAGADAYVTGQLRHPARDAAAESGMHTVAVGHRRSERWGLRQLAAAVQARWPGLVVRLEPEGREGTP